MRNAEHYNDPTAGKAINGMTLGVVGHGKSKKKHKPIESWDDIDCDRVSTLISAIKDMCRLAGFEVSGRITLVDKKTGKVWR